MGALMKNIGNGALDAFAALLVAHMVWYAFTGQTPVAPLQQGDGARLFLLLAIHVYVPMLAAFRRFG